VQGHARGRLGRIPRGLQVALEIFRLYGTINSSAWAERENNMTQSQIVQALAEKCEVTKKVSQGLLAALSDTAIREVKKNGVFVLPGIGRLVRVDRKARMGRNPATGEAIQIAAKKVVKFRVGKAAKDAIVPPKKAKA
jgi:DNA-binding protein HU-beta